MSIESFFVLERKGERGFLFLWVLGMGCVILLWHSLSLSYNYFGIIAFRAIQVQNADFFQMVHLMPFVLQQRRILKVI